MRAIEFVTASIGVSCRPNRMRFLLIPILRDGKFLGSRPAWSRNKKEARNLGRAWEMPGGDLESVPYVSLRGASLDWCVRSATGGFRPVRSREGYHKIPMNFWYGFRIPKSFQSDELWFTINEYGGKQLIFWPLFLIATGIIKFFLPMEDVDGLVAWFLIFGPLIIFPGVAIIRTFIFAVSREEC